MLSGIIPPLPTPFDASGQLDIDGLQRLITDLSPHVDGFLLLGSNGEAVYLREEERREVIVAARAVIPKHQPMLVGTGGEATALVAARNAEAAELGADIVLVLPPHYYQGAMNEAVLRQHYQHLADRSPLPLMLYNIPAATTLSLSPALVASLATHPNIGGLKDSSGNLLTLGEILRQVPEDFCVMTGNAPTLVAALAMGAKGGILAVANVVAEVYRRIYQHMQAGELEAARALQLRYNPLALAVTNRFGVPGLKATLRAQGRSAGYPRAPMQDVSAEVQAELQALLEAQTQTPA